MKAKDRFDPQDKRTYTSPRLKVYGPLQSLTAGGSRNKLEVGPGYMVKSHDFP